MHRPPYFFILSLLLVLLPAAALAHPVAQGSAAVSVGAEKILISLRVSMEELLVYQAHRPGNANEDLLSLYRSHGEYLAAHIFAASGVEPLKAELVVPEGLPSKGDVLPAEV